MSDRDDVEYLTFEAAALIAEGAARTMDNPGGTGARGAWNEACLEIARRFRRLEITRRAQRQAMDLDLERKEVDRE